jgi:hypothetical protein
MMLKAVGHGAAAVRHGQHGWCRVMGLTFGLPSRLARFGVWRGAALLGWLVVHDRRPA